VSGTWNVAWKSNLLFCLAKHKLLAKGYKHISPSLGAHEKELMPGLL
jgi:hypothetical protein